MALLPKKSLTRDLIVISLAMIFLWIFGMKMENAAEKEAEYSKKTSGQNWTEDSAQRDYE